MSTTEGRNPQHIQSYTLELDNYTKIYSDTSRIASIYSFLSAIGFECHECLEHYYDLVSMIIKKTNYEYFENAAVVAAQKKLPGPYLVNVWGEEYFAQVLEYLSTPEYDDLDVLKELLLEIAYSLGGDEEITRLIEELASRNAVDSLKLLGLLLLAVPPAVRGREQ